MQCPQCQHAVTLFERAVVTRSRVDSALHRPDEARGHFARGLMLFRELDLTFYLERAEAEAA